MPTYASRYMPTALLASSLLAAIVPTSLPLHLPTIKSNYSSASDSAHTPPLWPRINTIFTFGDSYSSTGFSRYGPQPSPQNPIGNPSYPGSTTIGSRDYIHFLTTMYNTSFTRLFDFACGGATIDGYFTNSPYESPCYNDGAPNFREQVERVFLPGYVPQRGKGWEPDNSLFTVWFGINDVFRVEGTGKPGGSLITDLMGLYSKLVEELYEGGARNFLFLNVPPMDRMPNYPLLPHLPIREENPRERLKRLIFVFNIMLNLTIKEFEEKHKDATVFLYDAHTLLDTVLDYPHGLGIKNTTDTCPPYANSRDEELFDPACGVPRNEYFWADDVHPTSTVHWVLAWEIVNMLGWEWPDTKGKWDRPLNMTYK